MENEKDIRRKFRQLKVLAKYGIFGMVVLGAIHCILLWCGYDTLAIHIIAVIFAGLLGFALSRLFGLCTIHKLAVVYICLLLLCIVLRRHGMFDTYVQSHRLGMAIAGLLITIMLVWNGTKRAVKSSWKR